MKKDQSSASTPKRDPSNNNKKAKGAKILSSIVDNIEECNNQISSLTYEEALKGLDILLENLQNDSLPVEDLQKNYVLVHVTLNLN